uniref:NADP-dependent oxidoreductase domain-containing protein n=1 Tax=Glossina morsitans morsitans TaxID=37546 RepID=A0A1B0G5E3_GLOMM
MSTENTLLKNVKSVPTILLSNALSMPMIGLGTWRLNRNPTDVIYDAIDVGYRHFDCAHIYRNEPEIGKAFKDLLQKDVIKREDIFVTSKLWNTFHEPSLVRNACETTLKNLCIEYLDNYLIHWPMAYKEGDELYPKDENNRFIASPVDYVDTWKAMEPLVDDGLCRTLGLSNFNVQQIERILKVARIPPSNLQIECHPYLNQTDLMEFCRSHNMVVTAYSPLGSPTSPYKKPGKYPILQNPKVLEISDKYKKTPAQVLIRYQIDRGNVVIPRSASKDHMLENFSLWDFSLKADDIQALDELCFGGRYMIMTDAQSHPHHPFADELS